MKHLKISIPLFVNRRVYNHWYQIDVCGMLYLSIDLKFQRLPGSIMAAIQFRKEVKPENKKFAL